MTDKKLSEEDSIHKKMAINLFNKTWGIMGKKDRTIDEDDEMLYTANASRFHWGKVGTHVNFLRGEWLISRVYTVLKRAEPALHHAQRCLDICLEHKIGDYDLAWAYEALARAYSVKGDKAKTEEFLKLGKEASEVIKKQDDKDLLFKELATI